MKNCTIIWLLLTVSCTQCFSQDITIYVSPTGKNSNKGTFASPFATVQRAQEEVHQVKEKSSQTRIQVVLLPGTYYLDTTLVFTQADGGSAKAPVVYKASSPGKAIISGGRKLSLKWTPWKNGIWKANASDVHGITGLFINGQLQTPARYPNFDSSAKYFNGVSPRAISAEKIKSWKDPVGGFVHSLHKHEWGSVHYRIIGVKNDTALQLEGGYQNNRPLGMNENIVFVSNIFEELDAPHEWFHDEKDDYLYYFPPKGLKLTTASVVFTKLNDLIVLKGTSDLPVQNLHFEGLTLTHTAPTFMLTKEPLLRSDWRIYRGGAVLFEGTENCSVQNSDFLWLGGNAIFLSNYNRHAVVRNCFINESGAGSILLVGDPNAVRNPMFDYNYSVPLTELDTVPGPKTSNYPSGCLIADNLIFGIGRIEKQVAGVQLSMCSDVTVSHNTIYNVPRAGINISEGTWGGHVIEYNDVFNTVMETGDHGAFNSWGRDRFWRTDYKQMDSLTQANPSLIKLDVIKPIILRNNRFRCDNGWDIDLDDGSSNYLIYNNVCLNGGIKLREGFFRTVKNNIIINNTLHPHVWFPRSHDRFMNNIVFDAYKPILVGGWGDTIDHNVFLDSASLLFAQKNGTDMHSKVGDPFFIRPKSGDYQVKKNSPALDVGFKNFPTVQFGVTVPRLKKKAQSPPIPQQLFTQIIYASETPFEWNGALIKKLSGLGARSATGMAEERGVHVLDVKPGSQAAGNGFQKNDVILQVDEKVVINPKDVITNFSASKWKGVIDVLIFRNQKELVLKVKP